MKPIKISFLLLSLCLLAFAACTKPDPELEAGATAQLQVNDPPLPACCADCGSSCLIGFTFSPNIQSGNGNQGGYKVSLVSATNGGDCACVKVNGEWTAQVAGNVTIQTAVYGGPGSRAACNQSPISLSQMYFSGGCSAPNYVGNGSGGPNPFGDWGQFTSDFLDSLQDALPDSLLNPPGPGLVYWPSVLGVDVGPVTPSGPVRVTLGGEAQMEALQTIQIFMDGTTTAVGSLTANGSEHYDLDFSDLPAGFYTVRLNFSPGFHLSTVLEVQEG